MDYDEDIIFTLDYVLTPGNYSPEKEEVIEPESKTKKTGWDSLGGDEKRATIIGIVFFVLIVFGLIAYCCCRSKEPEKDVANLKDHIPQDTNPESQTHKAMVEKSSPMKPVPEESEKEE